MTTLSISGGTIYLRQDTNIQYAVNVVDSWTNIENWPLTIQNLSPESTTLNVYFTTNITFTNADQYIIIDSEHITIDGQYNTTIYTVTIDNVTDYPGLIRNGTSLVNGYTNVTIQNMGVLSTNSSTNGGWVCQNYFGTGISSDLIYVFSCYSTGTISENAGGIFGLYTGSNISSTSQILAQNCYSTGTIAIASGGIFGWYAGSNILDTAQITAQNCYSTGTIGTNAGGIFASFAGQNATGGQIAAQNCYSTGLIGVSAGGIFGKTTGNNVSGTCQISAVNCYSTGIISRDAGGIFGESVCYLADGGQIAAQNCYSTGTIGTNAGGIFGPNGGIQSNTTQIAAQNCYSIGSINTYAGGIFGRTTGSDAVYVEITALHCYATGTIANNAGGIFGQAVGYNSGGQFTAQNCYSTGTIGTNAGGIFGSHAGYIALNGQITTALNCYTLANTIYGSSINANVTYTSNSTASGTGTWSNTLALSTILTDSINTWFVYDESYPWLLNAFNESIYVPDLINVYYGNTGTSGAGVFEPSYNYLMYNNSSTITDNVSISDPNVGELNILNTAPVGVYEVNVFVGKLNGSNYYAYNQNAFTFNVIYQPCFAKSTEILIIQNKTEQYMRIEDLRIGDFIKTTNYTYVPIKYILKLKFENKNNANILQKIHKIVNLPNQTKDLWITGGHSILVDTLTEEQQEKTLKYWKQPQKIGDKFLLLTCCNENAITINDNQVYDLYHLVLENNGNIKQAFGIYANGIETETMSEEIFAIHNNSN